MFHGVDIPNTIGNFEGVYPCLRIARDGRAYPPAAGEKAEGRGPQDGLPTCVAHSLGRVVAGRLGYKYNVHIPPLKMIELMVSMSQN